MRVACYPGFVLKWITEYHQGDYDVAFDRYVKKLAAKERVERTVGIEPTTLTLEA